MYTIFLADGFEEIEAISVIDIMRRSDLDIKIISIYDRLEIVGAHDIIVKADLSIHEVESTEVSGIILPGGMPGTINLGKSKELLELLDEAYRSKKMIAAICAAPTIIRDNKLFPGFSLTSYPSYKDEFPNNNYHEVDVVRAANLITSRGAGTAGEFGFAIVDYINGEGASADLKDAMVY
ncbi:MAG: DJ-1 family glyoxalase III [Acidaminobacteraceae bacterium]